MGIYQQTRSPYWWLSLPRGHGPSIKESTRIPVAAPTAEQRKAHRAAAELAFASRMLRLAGDHYELPAAVTASPDDAAQENDGTLGSWIDWYRLHVTVTHRGAVREGQILDRLRADLGDRPLTAITRPVAREWMTRRGSERTGPKRKKHPIAPATINREMGVLKALLAEAVESGKIDASPLAGMPGLHAPAPARRLLARDEEARLLRAIRRPDDRALLILAIDTLCRLGDCLDVQRKDDHGTRIWIGDPKAGKGYYVAVTPRLRTALNAIPKRGTKRYYFAHRRLDTPQKSAYAVRQMLERACAKCDPPIPYGRQHGGITWHWATRRTTATRMIQGGADLSTVQRAGRWASPQIVLGIYTESDDARVADAIKASGKAPPKKPKKGR